MSAWRADLRLLLQQDGLLLELKKAVFHRFQLQGDEVTWHWNGSSNSIDMRGNPKLQIAPTSIPNELR